jgi:hypothetical protein
LEPATDFSLEKLKWALSGSNQAKKDEYGILEKMAQVMKPSPFKPYEKKVLLRLEQLQVEGLIK